MDTTNTNYVPGNRSSRRRDQIIYGEQMKGFKEYLHLCREVISQGALSPSQQSRLETIIYEMRNSFFLPEKQGFCLTLNSTYQSLYRRRFLSL